MSLAQISSSSWATPMKLPITRATTGWATSLTRSACSRPSRRPSTSSVISRIALLVVGDPPRREPGLEQGLQAIVLGRVHTDEHRLGELEREHHRSRRDPALFGGVGLPVAADGVDVIRRRHRPEAGLLGELLDPRAPVDRALLAHPLEHLVGRARPTHISRSPTGRPSRSLPTAARIWSSRVVVDARCGCYCERLRRCSASRKMRPTMTSWLERCSCTVCMLCSPG